MLIRMSDGRIIIVNRSECKNEQVYNEKIYKIMYEYTNKYKNVSIYPPKLTSTSNNDNLKYLSDD